MIITLALNPTNHILSIWRFWFEATKKKKHGYHYRSNEECWLFTVELQSFTTECKRDKVIVT